MSKQVKIYVSRAFHFNAPDGSEHQFKSGANIVDRAIAEHPFVKAHVVDEEVAADTVDPKAYAAAIARAEAAEARVAAVTEELGDVRDALKSAENSYAAAVKDATALMGRATAAEAKVAALELAEAQRLAAAPHSAGKGK
jgi:hypothetical protein